MEPTRQVTSRYHVTLIRDVMTKNPITIRHDDTLERAHRLMRENALRHLPVLHAGKLVGVLTQRDLYFLESIAGVDMSIDVVADAMSTDVYAVSPTDSLRDVTRAMAAHKYGCAIVVESGRVTGIFTASDAVQLLSRELES